MGTPVPRNIVISAVNIRKGGTLTILRDCLRYLSSRSDFRVTALVHRRDLCDFPGIHYVELPWSVRSWLHRIWCEYVVMPRLSRKMQDIDLWFSLHDTTPAVKAQRQVAYCHNSFFSLHTRLRDWYMNPKIPLFALLTKALYKVNVRRNKYLVVQQEWMRRSLSEMLHFPSNRIILSPPSFMARHFEDLSQKEEVPIFFYPCGPDCHKNVETACEATKLLEKQEGRQRFKLVLTLSGSENRYARWLKNRYSHVSSIDFHGYMNQEELYQYYARAASLVFCSRVETWGLPISEFKPSGKPMILPDMPYARETAAGAASVCYYPCMSVPGLVSAIRSVLHHGEGFGPVPQKSCKAPVAPSWEEVFDLLLS